MRRSDRELSTPEARIILKEGEYGVLGMIDPDNRPYSIPVNFCILNDKVYFHCAAKGAKLDALEVHPEVSFCVVGNTKVIPDDFGTLYESAIVRGTVSEAREDEKQAALEGLLAKYSKDFIPEGLRYIEKMASRTRVFGIAIEEISGKARRA